MVDDGGPDVGFVGNPQQLIDTELAAVAGFSQPSLGEEVVEADGDDHRRWGAAGDRLIRHLQQPCAGLI